jgi:hypothetical protein
MNFTLNGIENLIKESKLEYKKIIKHVSIRNRPDDAKLVSVTMSCKIDKKFKDLTISCEFIRFAEDFIIICGSPILLKIIKTKIRDFLKIRGLEIHPNKSRTFIFEMNKPFDFLGYTFVYLIQTKHIHSKFLMSHIPEFRLQNRPKLYVYPSTNGYNSLKRIIIKIIRSSYNLTGYQLINILNPIIKG